MIPVCIARCQPSGEEGNKDRSSARARRAMEPQRCSTNATSCRSNHTAVRVHLWRWKKGPQVNHRLSSLDSEDKAVFLPWPLVSLVSQGDVNHSHQRPLQEGPVTLPVVLFQHLTATFRAYRKNQSPAWLQLLQQL